MIVVSKSKILDKTTKLERVCRYSDVPTEVNPKTNQSTGWVYDLTYMPIPYDLMFLKLQDFDYIRSGWWTGVLWKGLRLKKHDKIIAWKRNLDFE